MCHEWSNLLGNYMPILNTSITLTTQAIILKMLMKEVDQGVNVCWEIRQGRWVVCWINIRNSQVEAFPRSILVIPTVPGPWRCVPVPFLLVQCQWGRKNNHQVMLLLLLVMKVPLTLSVSYANLQANSQNKTALDAPFSWAKSNT